MAYLIKYGDIRTSHQDTEYLQSFSQTLGHCVSIKSMHHVFFFTVELQSIRLGLEKTKVTMYWNHLNQKQAKGNYSMYIQIIGISEHVIIINALLYSELL